MTYTQEQESNLRLAIDNLIRSSTVADELFNYWKEELAKDGVELKQPPVEGYDKGRVISKSLSFSETFVRQDPDAVVRMVAQEMMGSFQRTIRLSDWLEANGLKM